jgi:cell division protein FtsL
MKGWTGVNLLLLAAALGSAVFLVNTQYQARQTFMDLEKANQHARALDIERETLTVEKREAASNTKVEHLARTELGMHASPAGSMRFVRVPAAAPLLSAGGQP